MNRVPLELIFWSGGLTYLFFLNVEPDIAPPRLCLSGLIGVGICPGCGLGESISLLLGGQFAAGLKAHLLGPFALVVIVIRIIALIRSHFTIHRKEHSHGKTHAAASRT